jgi:hypothetical protein
MKKLVTLFLVLALVFAFAGLEAQAQSSKGAKAPSITFGFTNISKAMMLHPTMAHYKVQEGRFAPAASKEKQPEPGRKVKEFEAERAKLIEAKAQEDAKIEKVDMTFSKELNKLNAKYEKRSSEKGTDQYNKEKNQLENKYWIEREELVLKRAGIENSLEKLNEENAKLHLTSHSETSKIFSSMLDDIYEAVNQVADHYKVDFVFNSSFSVERTPVNPSFTPVNPMGEFLSMKPDVDAKEFLTDHGEDGRPPYAMTLDYWLACQRWAFRTTADPRLDKMFLKGGLDMTPAVVDLVYQKYKVSDAHRDVVQEFLRNHHD